MIRIVTDTSADITPAQAEVLGIELVPLDIHFEAGKYNPLQDDETFSTFYQMLDASEELPRTSQPTPERFLTIFQDAKEAGDDVVAILLSGKLSGTVQSATLAKELSGYERVYVIDSLTTIIGLRQLVDLALRLRAEGQDAGAIAGAIENAKSRQVLIAGLDTLKYLRKGGRIPKSVAMIGTVMGIKPLIELKDGVIISSGKARGHSGARKALLKLMQEKPERDPSMPFYFGYTKHADLCNAFFETLTESIDPKDTVMYPIGSVVGTHVGPGAYALVYLTKEA